MGAAVVCGELKAGPSSENVVSCLDAAVRVLGTNCLLALGRSAGYTQPYGKVLRISVLASKDQLRGTCLVFRALRDTEQVDG